LATTELKVKVTPSQRKVEGTVFGKYVRIIVGEGGEGGGAVE
jgi:hypothetical protein